VDDRWFVFAGVMHRFEYNAKYSICGKVSASWTPMLAQWVMREGHEYSLCKQCMQEPVERKSTSPERL